jgi:hypothetical protein
MDFIETCVDVTCAYLYQEYPFEQQPFAVTLQEGEVCDIIGIEKDQAFLLGRYIYGIPDFGKAYYIAFSNHIVKHHYAKSLLDPCLFYKIYNENFKDIILLRKELVNIKFCIH